jgi:cobyrinic acid a,c-diamide synthase
LNKTTYSSPVPYSLFPVPSANGNINKAEVEFIILIMAVVIAGERSGVGKTTVTIALLAFLRRHANLVQSFKVGPDYIDPMFHHYVTGRPCRNLDPVLTSQSYVQQCFNRYSQECEYSLIEGVMGLFDGVQSHDQMDFASTAHVARLLDLPVVLVIDCSRLSGSVAAIAHGYSTFDPRLKIAGVVLNRVGSDRHLSLLQNSLAPLQLPILGILRRQDNITIPDRHLGLVPTDELPELNTLINHLADLATTCFNWVKLLPLLKSPITHCYTPRKKCTLAQAPKVAIARDRAFNFYYQDNLDLLENLGAELVFWSPIADEEIPKGVQGMYFGGGFPEVFAEQLAANTGLLQSVKNAILAGIPTIAECGGLMYLCDQLIDFAGKSWSMVGVLPAVVEMSQRLTLGYRRGVVLQDSLLLDTGTTIFGHEFHHSRLISHPQPTLFQTYRYDCDDYMGFEGWSTHNVQASYVHQHWGESPAIPQKFIQMCLDA